MNILSPTFRRHNKALLRRELSSSAPCPFSGKNAAQRTRLGAAFRSMESKHNRPARLPFQLTR